MIGQLPNPGHQWRSEGDRVREDDHSVVTGLTGQDSHSRWHL
ncbi:hypothetical protein [Streptomyces sp. NPDC056661]